jgi:hypothetical protein
VVGGAVAGVVVFAVAAYVALMWFDCPGLIDDF